MIMMVLSKVWWNQLCQVEFLDLSSQSKKRKRIKKWWFHSNNIGIFRKLGNKSISDQAQQIVKFLLALIIQEECLLVSHIGIRLMKLLHQEFINHICRAAVLKCQLLILEANTSLCQIKIQLQVNINLMIV